MHVVRVRPALLWRVVVASRRTNGDILDRPLHTAFRHHAIEERRMVDGPHVSELG